MNRYNVMHEQFDSSPLLTQHDKKLGMNILASGFVQGVKVSHSDGEWNINGWVMSKVHILKWYRAECTFKNGELNAQACACATR